MLLIGVDGATLRVAEPMLERGALPSLGRIAAEGVLGPLRSLHPLFSPRIWNSIATGVTPEKHGILGFAYQDSKGTRRLYQSGDRKVRALWNIASEAGLGVVVVNWWTTYPPEPISGVMVSDQAARNAADPPKHTVRLGGPFVSPAEWEDRVHGILAAHEESLPDRDPFLDNRALAGSVPRKRLSEVFRSDGVVVQAALALEAATDPDLLVVFLKGIDRVSHRLFPSLEPQEQFPRALRLSAREAAAGAEALRAYYAYTDALVGRLASRFDPDDLVIVVSDHGFESRVRGNALRGEHRGAAAEYGVVFARGRQIPAAERAQGMSVLDVTPTILAWLGLPVADDMDGQPAAFLQVEPVPSIPTYEGGCAARTRTAPSELEPEILEELGELGYFER